MVDGRWFVATVDHAVAALWVSGCFAVVVPFHGVEQFLKGIDVAFLQQVAGSLPAEDVVCGVAPRSAFKVAAAHQELEKQG